VATVSAGAVVDGASAAGLVIPQADATATIKIRAKQTAIDRGVNLFIGLQ
jgi:hypothetical protein